MITLHAGDCLVAPWRSKRDAWITDPPANISFMGRKWDKFLADQGFTPPIPPRSKAHLRELQSEFAFQRYWGERFGSGGTAIACQLLGLDFEGAELCPEAVEITNARLAFWSGLSFSALEQFKLTGTLPTNSDASNVGNLSLFD